MSACPIKIQHIPTLSNCWISESNAERMTRLRFMITEEMMQRIAAEADTLWPGQGILAVRRLVNDSLRRLWRYCSAEGRARNRNG